MKDRAKELRRLGEAARRKDPAAARRYYEEAVAVLRTCNDPQLLAHTVRHLGDVFLENGEVRLAEPYFAEALRIYREDPATPGLHLANAIRSMALYKDKVGSHIEAQGLWAEAGELYRLAGVEAGVQECAVRTAS